MGQGALAGHAVGQAQGVGQDFRQVDVGQEAQAPLGQATAGVVDAGDQQRRDSFFASDEDPFVVGEIPGQLEKGLERRQQPGMGEGELAVLEDQEGATDALLGELVVELLHAPPAHLTGQLAAGGVGFGTGQESAFPQDPSRLAWMVALPRHLC